MAHAEARPSRVRAQSVHRLAGIQRRSSLLSGAASTSRYNPGSRCLLAASARMLGLSRDKADGAHPYLVPPEHTLFARNALGPGPILAPEQAVVIHGDPATAREIARAHLGDYLALPNYVNNLRYPGFGEDDLPTAAAIV
jgi:probable F420-dependent oxidoreductase